MAPEGDWLVWLILAGRGFGKTRSGAEWVRAQMCGDTPLARGRCRHIALIGETAADTRKVMVGDGQGGGDSGSGILQVHPKDFRPTYNPSLKRLTWPNGAIASLYNATEPDELRGPEHDGAWCDELAKWQYARETWDMLQFGLRIGDSPRIVITTTPRPIPLLKEIMKDSSTRITSGSSYENQSNLSPVFINKVIKPYEGTRLGRQELKAEVLDDVPGALWTLKMIDELRVGAAGMPEELPDIVRTVVAIDPSGTKGMTAKERQKQKLRDTPNDVGIIVASKGVDGHAYVRADLTCNLSPESWARRAVEDGYYQFAADRIIAEINFGGAMVEAVVRAHDPKVSFKCITASRGKVARAEPIAALYEKGLVHHVGTFTALEDQMTQMLPDGFIGEGSPDRVDAKVWALTELMLGYQPPPETFAGAKVFSK